LTIKFTLNTGVKRIGSPARRFHPAHAQPFV